MPRPYRVMMLAPVESRRLAIAQSHGGWIEWRA
jgi:hypothetical protein